MYIYSQAITTKEAEDEATYIINLINKYKDKITLPVVFDFEFGGRLNASVAKKLGKTKTTDICEAFCDKVKAAGYVPMVYANYDMLTNYLDKETLHKKYKIWLAHYTDKTSYTGMDWWQYTSSGKVKGISGNVDMNHVYK